MIPSLAPRSDYAGLSESVYLNQAALGLLGEPVVKAMHRFLDDVARHGNLRMSDTDEAAFLSGLRERAAELLHADADRIAIVSSASELLGQASSLLPPIAGRNVLLVAGDFPAITRPWLRLASDGECQLQFVHEDPESDLTDDLLEAIDERTALVAVSAVQYTTGSQIDVPRLQRAAECVGASLIIDATQAAGAIVTDTRSWHADIVVTSGYKWIGGHGGVALGVMDPSLLERVPFLPGWMGAPDPFAFDATQLLLASDARRYTQSTMSYISVAGLAAALDERSQLGEAPIETHARRLADVLIEASSRSGWQPYRNPSDPAFSPHIISLMKPGIDMDATCESLRKKNIVCGTRGGRIRISLAPYNDESDLDTLVAELR